MNDQIVPKENKFIGLRIVSLLFTIAFALFPIILWLSDEFDEDDLIIIFIPFVFMAILYAISSIVIFSKKYFSGAILLIIWGFLHIIYLGFIPIIFGIVALITLSKTRKASREIKRQKYERVCPSCGYSYNLNDYLKNAPIWYCSNCNQAIPKD